MKCHFTIPFLLAICTSFDTECSHEISFDPTSCLHIWSSFSDFNLSVQDLTKGYNSRKNGFIMVRYIM